MKLPPSFSETERTHISPNLLDVGEAFVLSPAFSYITPAQCILSVGGPDGVLLFMVYDDFVDRRVLIHISIHGSSFRAKGIASVISGFTALSRRDVTAKTSNPGEDSSFKSGILT